MISQPIVGFEVFTAVVMKSIIFWDMMPCCLIPEDDTHPSPLLSVSPSSNLLYVDKHFHAVG
jgi:hypothetical protein